MTDFYRFTDDEVAEWATKPDNSIWPTGKDWNTYCLASEVSELRAEVERLRADLAAERGEVKRPYKVYGERIMELHALKADLAAERALADQLAEQLAWHDMTDPALTTYKEARNA